MLVLALGLSGTLPISWATAFPNLQVGLCSSVCEPHGLLPGNKYHVLQVLNLAENQIVGPLPAAWILAPSAFPRCRPARMPRRSVCLPINHCQK